MLKIPEEPEKFIYYCVILLPGFLTLGLVVHVTEQNLSEFAFTYIAVAISVVQYVLADAVLGAWARLRRILGRVLWRGRIDGSNGAIGRQSLLATVLVISAMSAFVSLAIINAVQSDQVLGTIRKLAPFRIDRLGASEPLVHLVKNEQRIQEIDERPTDVMINQHYDKQAAKCSRAPYSMYARVTADDKTYEGRISYYNGSAGKQGLPFLLSPACRVLDGPPEQVEVVPGPGVMIFDNELNRVEFLEMYASACWRLLNPDAPPAGKCPKKAP